MKNVNIVNTNDTKYPLNPVQTRQRDKHEKEKSVNPVSIRQTGSREEIISHLRNFV